MSITSANSIFALGVDLIFPIAQILQGYAADDAFMSDQVKPGEAVMGVDGQLSGGYTPYPTIIKIRFQADSPSISLFEQWMSAQKSAKDIFTAFGSIVLPSIGSKYTLANGILTGGSAFAPAKKILDPRDFEITFQDCNPSPIL
jgi:hypothetical protein